MKDIGDDGYDIYIDDRYTSRLDIEPEIDMELDQMNGTRI